MKIWRIVLFPRAVVNILIQTLIITPWLLLCKMIMSGLVFSFFSFFFFYESWWVSAQWLELILVTLHYTEWKRLQFNPGVYINRRRQNTSDFTHLPKRPEWSMILHTTSDNFVILKQKRLKGNREKSNTDHVRLPHGHT